MVDSYTPSPLPSPGNQLSPLVDHTSGGSPDGSSFGPDLPLADLRLLHHWTTYCADSMHPYSAERSEFWKKDFVDLGFEFPFLLRGFLALAAVHKASYLQSSERQSLLLQADSHISQALATYRTHLESPNVETAVPMFVLSSILLTYNFGSAQLERPEDPIGALHHCFMLLQGIRVVVIPNWAYIKDDPAIIHITEMASPTTLAMLDILAKEDKPQEILSLKELTEVLLDSADKEACTAAIDELHENWVRSRHLPRDRDEYSLLFLWPARVNSRFFDLFAAHNPVAVIITTHFAALLAQCRPVWWAVKWPQWLLATSEHMLAATPDLLKWLAWPQQVISAQLSASATPIAL